MDEVLALTTHHEASISTHLTTIQWSYQNAPNKSSDLYNDTWEHWHADAIRENDQAIATILRNKGGLLGMDPQMEEARAAHAEARKIFVAEKRARKELKARLFKRQDEVLERLTEIYKTMSEALPVLCKNMNLLR